MDTEEEYQPLVLLYFDKQRNARTAGKLQIDSETKSHMLMTSKIYLFQMCHTQKDVYFQEQAVSA